MTPTEARERSWEISRIKEGSRKELAAREAFMREMQAEAEKISPHADWFRRAVTTYTISQFADLIKYRGPTTEVRAKNLLDDLNGWAAVEPGWKLADYGRTYWQKEFQPLVEKRKKKGEHVLTLHGKCVAYELADFDR